MSETQQNYKPRPFTDFIISILIPSVILMKYSGPEDLGATNALLIALAFPVSWGLYELFRFRHFNFIALLGLISVFFTGGIGLLELDPKWLAVKEAAVPGVIGLAVLLSTFTQYPLVRTLVYSPKIFDVETIQKKLDENDGHQEFDTRLRNANFLLAGTFVFSSIVNYMLAITIVTSPAGTAAFNEELGQMSLLSYPIIVLPSMIMMAGILYYLWRTISGLTGLTLEEAMANQEEN